MTWLNRTEPKFGLTNTVQTYQGNFKPVSTVCVMHSKPLYRLRLENKPTHFQLTL
jgi:hypothetical protein